MKDAKGHGSNAKGGGESNPFPPSYRQHALWDRAHGKSSYLDMTAAVSHQSGVNAAVPQTPEAHIMAGGKIPTEAQYQDLQERNQAALKAWRSFDGATTDFGKQAMTRLQAELAQSKDNYQKFGSEEKPTALTRSLRGQK